MASLPIIHSILKVHFNTNTTVHPILLRMMAANILTSTNIDYLQRHFNVACQQVIILNREVSRYMDRHEHDTSTKAMRYSIRLKLIILEGTRGRFFEYAKLCKRRIEFVKESLVVGQIDRLAI